MIGLQQQGAEHLRDLAQHASRAHEQDQSCACPRTLSPRSWCARHGSATPSREISNTMRRASSTRRHADLYDYIDDLHRRPANPYDYIDNLHRFKPDYIDPNINVKLYDYIKL
jgi:hypothetical protein